LSYNLDFYVKVNLQGSYSRTLRISSLGIELGEEKLKESFSEEQNIYSEF